MIRKRPSPNGGGLKKIPGGFPAAPVAPCLTAVSNGGVREFYLGLSYTRIFVSKNNVVLKFPVNETQKHNSRIRETEPHQQEKSVREGRDSRHGAPEHERVDVLRALLWNGRVPFFGPLWENDRKMIAE